MKGTPMGSNCLEQLAEAVSEHPCSVDQMARCFNAFCIHLESAEKNSFQKTKESGLIMIDAIHAISGIQQLMDRNFYGEMDVKPAYMQCITRFWPKIWAWISYAHTAYTTSVGDFPGDVLRLDFRNLSINTLMSFIHMGQLRDRLILPTEGLLEIIIQLWIMDIEDPFFALSLLKGDHPRISSLLDECLIGLHAHTEQFWMEYIVKPAGGLKKFSAVALAHLRHDTKQQNINLNKLLHDIHILTIASQHNRIRNTLVYCHCAADVTKHLVALTKRSPSDNFELVGKAIDYCMFNLAMMINGGGAPTVVEALDAHLLVGILKTEPWLEHISGPIFPILYPGISRYFIFRSVLTAASRELRKVRDLLLEDEVSREGEIWEKWVQLRTTIDEGISSMYDAGPDDLGETCHSKEVRICILAMISP